MIVGRYEYLDKEALYRLISRFAMDRLHFDMFVHSFIGMIHLQLVEVGKYRLGPAVYGKVQVAGLMWVKQMAERNAASRQQ